MGCVGGVEETGGGVFLTILNGLSIMGLCTLNLFQTKAFGFSTQFQAEFVSYGKDIPSPTPSLMP